MLVFLSVFGYSQEFSKEIETQFKDYNQLIINKNFGKALDTYANEDFLKIVPRDQMVQAMEQIFSSKEMEFKTYDPQNIIVQNGSLKSNGKTYIKLSFDQRIDMKFANTSLSKEILLAALQREFGSENVKFNDQSKFYEIKAHKNAVANSVDNKAWKFTVLERDQMQLLAQFLPKELIISTNQ